MFHSSSFSATRRVLAAVLPVAVAVTFAGAASAEVTADQQAQYVAGLSSVGQAEGIGYHTTVAPDLRTVSATVDDGRFVLAQDGTLTVENAAGSPIAQVPTSFGTVGGNTITVATQISEDGRTLTATPQMTQAAAAEVKTIATNPAAQYSDPVHNAAAIGAGVGLVAAAVVCIPMITTMILYLPCVGLVGLPNALVGALIGAAVGAVVPEVIPQVLP
ncbi:hypothetical protein FEK33_06615 [Nocardia asteroides NBRC 15531]|uniref:DUF8020 domain-containing protein n=1 Tax=Nocardia asteroides NBRC 15531 TaxID=1110697 RepID=U5E4C3_NOCAS|nr:hypothetical protein [Nocardia asteroides]TLF69922.1 hypothetical protein FEK33_06615 [Nocardia asteroides NBRC 15531]UGT49433.1 hypothetical protein LT345_02090 [Nocardia asteroides]SFL90330.1 hypothetical protein SAMN05444423_1011339 [Nocardia asteroides]VEG38037.1 Uncharacterised protein [Nocardia asteroides]GAD84032.1 hypothetical protein NCAST_20_06020 [Nocardia asteroides NBRC 15531]